VSIICDLFTLNRRTDNNIRAAALAAATLAAATTITDTNNRGEDIDATSTIPTTRPATYSRPAVDRTNNNTNNIYGTKGILNPSQLIVTDRMEVTDRVYTSFLVANAIISKMRDCMSALSEGAVIAGKEITDKSGELIDEVDRVRLKFVREVNTYREQRLKEIQVEEEKLQGFLVKVNTYNQCLKGVLWKTRPRVYRKLIKKMRRTSLRRTKVLYRSLRGTNLINSHPQQHPRRLRVSVQ